MKDLNNNCFLCGIYNSNGIMLNEKHICEKWEKDIVNSHVKEQTYDYYLKMIKRILFDKNIIQWGCLWKKVYL